MSKILFKLIITSLILLPYCSLAEPVIVFPRTSSSLLNDGNTNNPFIIDENYSATHLIKRGDVLGGIIRKYYDGSSLDRNVLQFGIVRSNKHAFRGGNANFMLAGKQIKLPSINNFRDMVFRRTEESGNWTQDVKSSNIYFFGN
ncbi:MAG: hypothetical protein VX397_02970 [Pseudomonadota bacterium]|nr:hypothetical protein [Pseudomonadota bacterium]